MSKEIMIKEILQYLDEQPEGFVEAIDEFLSNCLKKQREI